MHVSRLSLKTIFLYVWKKKFAIFFSDKLVFAGYLLNLKCGGGGGGRGAGGQKAGSNGGSSSQQGGRREGKKRDAPGGRSWEKKKKIMHITQYSRHN